MTFKTPSLGRALLVSTAAILLASGLSACGRRGPLEPPEASVAAPPARTAAPADPRLRRSRQGASAPSTLATRPAAVVEDAPEDEESPEAIHSVIPSPTPTPRSRRTRPEFVPTDPFVLDALL